MINRDFTFSDTPKFCDIGTIGVKTQNISITGPESVNLCINPFNKFTISLYIALNSVN